MLIAILLELKSTSRSTDTEVSLKAVLSASGISHVKPATPVDRRTSLNCVSVFELWLLQTEAAITLEAFLTGSNWLLTRNTYRKEDRRDRDVDRDLIHLLELLSHLKLKFARCHVISSHLHTPTRSKYPLRHWKISILRSASLFNTESETLRWHKHAIRRIQFLFPKPVLHLKLDKQFSTRLPTKGCWSSELSRIARIVSNGANSGEQ